jgi:hypothetical protein
MDLKLDNTNFYGTYVQVPDKIDGNVEKKSLRKKRVTFNLKNNKYKCYLKYSLIFISIIFIILMVIFGINYASLDCQTVPEVNATIPEVEINITIPQEVDIEVDTTIAQEVEIFSPKQFLDILEEDNDYDNAETESTTEEEGQDIIITNKNVVVNGENKSIIITN